MEPTGQRRSRRARLWAAIAIVSTLLVVLFIWYELTPGWTSGGGGNMDCIRVVLTPISSPGEDWVIEMTMVGSDCGPISRSAVYLRLTDPNGTSTLEAYPGQLNETSDVAYIDVTGAASTVDSGDRVRISRSLARPGDGLLLRVEDPGFGQRETFLTLPP